jgi:hypothetical protein
MAGCDERDPPEAGLERRLIRDEIRLARDEERIAQEERWIRRNWWLALALAGLLTLTIAALAISVVALDAGGRGGRAVPEPAEDGGRPEQREHPRGEGAREGDVPRRHHARRRRRLHRRGRARRDHHQRARR